MVWILQAEDYNKSCRCVKGNFFLTTLVVGVTVHVMRYRLNVLRVIEEARKSTVLRYKREMMRKWRTEESLPSMRTFLEVVNCSGRDVSYFFCDNTKANAGEDDG